MPAPTRFEGELDASLRAEALPLRDEQARLPGLLAQPLVLGLEHTAPRDCQRREKAHQFQERETLSGRAKGCSETSLPRAEASAARGGRLAGEFLVRLRLERERVHLHRLPPHLYEIKKKKFIENSFSFKK